MSLFSVSIKCLIVIAFSIFLAKLELWKRISPSRNATIVALGILSARENFIQRETVRSTWLKDYLSYNSDSVKAWFIVGNRSCHIPPQYRLSYYGCEKWNLNVSGLKENFFTSIERKSGSYERTIQQGFSFKVRIYM